MGCELQAASCKLQAASCGRKPTTSLAGKFLQKKSNQLKKLISPPTLLPPWLTEINNRYTIIKNDTCRSCKVRNERRCDALTRAYKNIAAPLLRRFAAPTKNSDQPLNFNSPPTLLPPWLTEINNAKGCSRHGWRGKRRVCRDAHSSGLSSDVE